MNGCVSACLVVVYLEIFAFNQKQQQQHQHIRSLVIGSPTRGTAARVVYVKPVSQDADRRLLLLLPLDSLAGLDSVVIYLSIASNGGNFVAVTFFASVFHAVFVERRK